MQQRPHSALLMRKNPGPTWIDPNTFNQSVWRGQLVRKKPVLTIVQVLITEPLGATRVS